MRREESEVKGGLGLKAPTLARHRVREVEHRGVQIEGVAGVSAAIPSKP